MPPRTDSLRSTPLTSRHAELGARLVPFAGWEMPIQYEGVIDEHRAVRSSAGVFDVSHMGQVRISGPGSEELLQRATSNDISAMGEGGAQYGLLCTDDGGVLDDLISYRIDGGFLTVTNASRHQHDFERLSAIAASEGFDAAVTDESDGTAMLAVQGPDARAIVESLAADPLPGRMRIAGNSIGGHELLIAGTGYTGEDGVEILAQPAAALPIWDALLGAGAVACGLGARDTLRLEACFPLHGNEIDPSRNPIEAGLGWACREDTGFIGSDAIRSFRESGTGETLVAFELTEGGIARAGNQVVGGGTVTSGTFSPSLGKGVGLAYVATDRSRVASEFEIDVRGKLRPAIVRERPLYRKG